LRASRNDFADFLSIEKERELNNLLGEHFASTSNQVVLVSVNDMGGDYIEHYSIKLAEKIKAGDAKKDNGVLFLISKNDRKFRIEMGYGLEPVLTDGISNYILQNILKKEFQNNNYEIGIENSLREIVNVLEKNVEGNLASINSSANFPQSKNSFFAVFLGLLPFILFFGILLFEWLAAVLGRTKSWWLSGADIVKVGIGPGSACTTRRMTGVGYPQLSAVIECADAAHGLNSGQGCGLIIADGGQQYPSCISKAFCGGADFNMFGSMFSGYEESGGETIEKDGKKYKEYFGSSSNHAMEKLYGKKDAHRASEGRYTLIPFKGSIHNFLQDMFGALRSTGTYIGAKTLKEFPKRATFIRVNRQLTDYLERFDQNK
jgi:uncharacterized membrane protein YgcG